MISGIYKICNKINGKSYIGSAVNIPSRWRTHLSGLRRNKNQSKKLQRAWNKYGEDCFDFSIIEDVKEKKDLIKREQFFIDQSDRSMLYNILPTAGSNLGFRHSEETKRKIGNSHIGMKRSEETRKNISKATMGRVPSDKQREITSKKFKGCKLSAEHKKKISLSKIGKKRPKELCERMSISQRIRFQKEREDMIIFYNKRNSAVE